MIATDGQQQHLGLTLEAAGTGQCLAAACYTAAAAAAGSCSGHFAAEVLGLQLQAVPLSASRSAGGPMRVCDEGLLPSGRPSAARAAGKFDVSVLRAVIVP